ncbi:hypothetical protein ACFLUV_00155 [Elusimicrobiota bacterium]
MLMLKYIGFLILFILALFGLYELTVRLLDKYRPKLEEKFGMRISRKETNIEFNNGCLIIAAVLFFMMIVPNINKLLFIIMGLIFAIRSLYGKLTVFRGILLFIGSAFISIFVISLTRQALTAIGAVIVLVVGLFMVIVGFRKPAKYRKAKIQESQEK